jgi:hypothetical protein
MEPEEVLMARRVGEQGQEEEPRKGRGEPGEGCGR